MRHQSDCFAPDFYGHRVDLSIDGCVFVTFLLDWQSEEDLSSEGYGWPRYCY
ncbi:hypothetical protein XAC3612_1130019 [Xanthomonas citri pv. citri]|nr:hypothetical protein XAC3612_1130019 [Xanthomonas citri pv. citri]